MVSVVAFFFPLSKLSLPKNFTDNNTYLGRI